MSRSARQASRMLALEVLPVVLQGGVWREHPGEPASYRGLAGRLVVGAEPFEVTGDEPRERGAVLPRIPLGVLERGAVDADGKLGLFHAVQHTTLLHGINVYLRAARAVGWDAHYLSLIHISEPTRLGMISYAVFCLKKKK